ncbi:MAG: M14 family zinc carboxypeptidase [Planctomycetota bacterium]
MRFPTLALCGLFLQTALSAQDSSASFLYLVKNPTLGQRLLLQQHFDVLGNCCGTAAHATGPVEVVVQQGEVAAFLSIVPSAEMQRVGRPFHDVELERAVANGEDVPDPGYYTVAEIEAAIDAQVALYPGLAQKVDLSALPGGVLTHEGRSIFALKVSDNVGVNEDEPAIVLAAQHHARELNAPHMVIGAMQRVLAAYASNPTLQAVVDGYEIYFVPMVNPDGVNFVWTANDLWRKNRRNNGGGVFGVDNNRNYPFLWSICGSSATTSNDTYRGPSAGSEPETMVMRNLIARLRPEVYLDFHSYGQDVLRMWAPCATVNPIMQTFQQLYCDDLRNQMGFSTRDPSASGEAPEDHFASGGTLSYLIEVGTAFQPAFTATVAEEATVWPGVQRVLTTWRPAVRGHVRSALGSAPLASTITFAPNVFNHGEKTMSRASDGRYGLWLPIGSWNVTFAAAGHQSRTVPVTVTSLNAPVQLDVLLETAGPTPTITKVGTGSIGTLVTYTYTSPGDMGKTALFGWAFGTSFGIPLGDLRVISIDNDFLFQNALSGNPFLSPTWVTLNGVDQGQAVLIIPNMSWLIGITTYVNGITFDPLYQTGIKTWSQAVGVTIIP